MIAWSIDVAKESNLFDHIIVSTDDIEIAEIAQRWGAKVPFIRPDELSDDFTPTVPVIAHAVRESNRLGWVANYVCCIYPCAPFIQTTDLFNALYLITKRNVDFVYPVTEYAHPIQRAMRQLDNQKMEFLYPDNELKRSQDFEKNYHDSGQFYWGKSLAWIEHKKMHTDGLGMPIPKWRVVDIDTLDDWVRAELVHQTVLKLK